MESKLVIALVGLPAKGKSTLAQKLKSFITPQDYKIEVFNNGDLRRTWSEEQGVSTAHPDFFYSEEGRKLRDSFAMQNMVDAKAFLRTGDIAVLDATNLTLERREQINRTFSDLPVLYIQCGHDDEDILKESIRQKLKGKEFAGMNRPEAFRSFQERIECYYNNAHPVSSERNYFSVDSLYNNILSTNITDQIPHQVLVRNVLTKEWIKNLYVLRHGKTYYNLEDRIGGDSPLNEKGWAQARAVKDYFRDHDIEMVFTSPKKRAKQMAKPLCDHLGSRMIEIKELDEIDAGICEELTYNEIKSMFPTIYEERKKDKFNYVYPDGESYSTMIPRIVRGLKKAIFIAGNTDQVMLIGHQGANRVILREYFNTKDEEVPYIYVPQNQFYRISSDLHHHSVELVRYSDIK
ncbi:MAG: histidine phosphatase family protein [Nanobdellota archaeon]